MSLYRTTRTFAAQYLDKDMTCAEVADYAPDLHSIGVGLDLRAEIASADESGMVRFWLNQSTFCVDRSTFLGSTESV